MYTYPTVADFKTYFARDFPFGVTTDFIMDSDICKAFGEAEFNFNGQYFAGNQAEFTILFFYLAAHYLVMDMRASSQGIAGKFAWNSSSKGVGQVSESYAIPQKILDDPNLSIYSTTTYGVKYLSLIMPQIIGGMFSSFAGARA